VASILVLNTVLHQETSGGTGCKCRYGEIRCGLRVGGGESSATDDADLGGRIYTDPC